MITIKEKMLNSFTTILILFLSLFTPLIIQAQNSQGNLPFIDPTPGEISIVASTPIPHGLQPTHKAYEDLIECGFNLGMEGADINYYKKQFNAIGDLNFKYIINSPEIRTDKRINYIKELANDPHFAGWQFRDEVPYNDISSLVPQYYALHDADPNSLIYMNLIGVISSYFTGPYKNYADFLNYIQKLFKPALWSYDFYPILVKEGKTLVDLQTFYYDLECVSAIAKSTGRPFWNYSQSMKHTTSSFIRPEAKEEFLRFEAFSSLAYGCQGIVYWTYGQRVSTENEKYYSALVNLDNKKTKAWYAAKKVNSEIKKFNEVFYQCKVKDIRHTGDVIYKGTKKLSGKFGPFKMIRSGSSGVIVSLIENNGSVYIVIVSRNVFKKQKVSLELLPNQSVVDLCTANPVQYSWRKDIVFNLDKGGYKIFKII